MNRVDEALAAYREYYEKRLLLVAEWMRRERDVQDVLDHDMKHRPPMLPPRGAPPPLVWYYRPEGIEETYNPYDLQYRRRFLVGDTIFRRGSGRTVANRSTRWGRVNWPESRARVKAWSDRVFTEEARFQHEKFALEKKLGQAALAQVPHTLYRWKGWVHACILLPDDEYLILSEYEATPALGSYGNDTREPTMTAVSRISSIEKAEGVSHAEARVRYQDLRRAEAPLRVAELLKGFGCAESSALEFACTLGEAA